MKTIGSVLMILGLGFILLLVLSIWNVLPEMLDERLPGGWELYGLGIGFLVGGSILRHFDGIFQSALEAAFDAVREAKQGKAIKDPGKGDQSDASH